MCIVQTVFFTRYPQAWGMELGSLRNSIILSFLTLPIAISREVFSGYIHFFMSVQ
jgi:hypothetical protein